MDWIYDKGRRHFVILWKTPRILVLRNVVDAT